MSSVLKTVNYICYNILNTILSYEVEIGSHVHIILNTIHHNNNNNNNTQNIKVKALPNKYMNIQN